MKRGPSTLSEPRLTALSLFLLSAATLVFEINLTRLFSVAQFYHFAFMIVSLALLGFGASGTALTLFPTLGRKRPVRSLGWLALAAGLCIPASYLLTNFLPFDSFSIAWDRRQTLVLILHYLALASPFFFAGMAVGLLLAANPLMAGQTYAVNLLGSALGCILALAAPSWLGGEGTVVFSSALAALAALVTLGQFSGIRPSSLVFRLSSTALLLLTLSDLGLRLAGRPGLALFELHLSPYKGLSYALQAPGADVIYRRWNAFSRVDMVRSPSIHSLPGLSYRYLLALPPEDGLLVDGDDLSPVLRLEASPGLAGEQGLEFAAYLSTAIAYQLRPRAEALVLEPRGGLDVLAALALGARRVTAVEANPLIVAAAPQVYEDPRLQLVIEADRSYIRRTREQFDIVVLSLVSSYHPIRSGAYSLAEDYRYTVESFQDALARLRPDGLLVVTRWLQNPPSEELRAFALAVTALERSGADPAGQIVALRGYNTATILVKNSPFLPHELQAVRAFAAERAFDLIYAPGIRPGEVNQYNVLPEPVYYEAFTGLLETRPRQDFYDRYPYQVSPPVDDHPFFGHFFKWSQAGQVLAELGRTWQPFGGAGYFVILALLALALFSAAGLILLPVAAARLGKDQGAQHPNSLHAHASPPKTFPLLSYFGWIGLAFLLVEIPLIQRFILFLGHPAYALTAVLFAVLLFSGIGSSCSSRVQLRAALVALILLLLGLPLTLPPLFRLALGLPLALRLGLSLLILAPLGFLMGIPFPAGVRWLYGFIERPTDQPAGDRPAVVLPDDQGAHSLLVPWAWAANGAASVVSAVMAALLALSLGFTWVFAIGAACYAAAWLTVSATRGTSPPRPR